MPLLLGSGCSSLPGFDDAVALVSSPSPGVYRGAELTTPYELAKAGSRLFATEGAKPVTLQELQQGHLMVVFFGYTHCPDVCPTTMADLGQALRKSTPAVQRAVRVVFVSSDPERDTPARTRAWLDHFDEGLPTRFVGLTGRLSDVHATAKALGVPLDAPKRQPDGSITVDHGAQVLAFRDGKASVVWLPETPVGDLVHDLALLAQGLA
jgi:protein SCO1/2